MSKKGIFAGIAVALVFAVVIIVTLTHSGTAPIAGPNQTGTLAASNNASPPSDTPPPTNAKKEESVTVTRVSVNDFQVLSFNKPIVVSFSTPMVKESELESLVEEKDFPFVIEPEVKGKGRWLTRDSFAFVADSPGYRPGVEYRLRFRENIRSVDDKPTRFFLSFRTRKIEVAKLDAGFVDKKNLELPLYVGFSDSVSGKALREHTVFKDSDSGETLEYVLENPEGNATSHTLRVKLGKERSSVTMSMRTDTKEDQALMGLTSAFERKITVTGSAPAVVSQKKAGNSPIAISNSRSWEDGKGGINVRFSLSRALATHNQKEFIKIVPERPYTLSSSNEAIIIKENLEPDMDVTVTLLPGLVDAKGDILKEERSHTVHIGNREACVRLLDEGNLLTPVYGNRLAISLCNVDQVNVQVYRQYENNLPMMTLSPHYFVKDLMRDISFKSIRIKDLKKNEVARRAIDLEAITKGRKGVYFVDLTSFSEVKDGQDSYMSYENSVERLIVISDIGGTARVYPSGITVFATSISTAEPIADAVIKVYSRSNQLIASGKAGPDGVFVHKRPTEWDSQLQPNLVTIEYGQGDDRDLTFLNLNYNNEASQSDNGERPYLDKGYEAFVYTPRGVFRPGETVDVKAFVRDKDQAAPVPFPVLFKLLNPRGTEIARSSATLSTEGGADFNFTLPASAATGEYTARVEVPGQTSPVIGSCSFAVEDFVPPRIEVSVNAQKKQLTAENSLKVDLSSQYLFGAPGADLKYELGYRASKKAFSPKNFDGYSFGNNEKKFTSESNLRYLTGALDAKGLKEENFKAPSDWNDSLMIHVLLVLSVQEDGGRWVSKTDAIDYFAKPYLLGLKLESSGHAPGKAVSVSVAAVTPEGETTDSGKLSVEISRIQSNWHTVYRDGRNVYTWEERFIAYDSKEVQTTGGRGSFSFTPARSGYYLVRVATEDGSIVATRRVGVWGYAGEEQAEGTGRMDLIDLSLDKKEYNVGDKAKLSIKAPFGGTLFLGIESGGQLSTKVIRMQQPAITEEILVTKEMNPNASITAWVARPLKGENREWFSHRARGHISLRLSKEPLTLKVAAEAPRRALPSKPLEIPFTVTDSAGKPVEGEFSVALIDEGILSLTMFKTPDPVSFFMAQRYMLGRTYDAYDSLLRPEAKATPLLTAGGGGLADYQGSLSTEQIFLTAYLPTVRTDANGKAIAAFTIPEYSGKGRLMIVGASKNRFASAETQVRFARDVVMEATGPRAVAPGDSFDLSLKLFTLESEEGDMPLGNATIRVKAEGPASLSGETEKTVSLTPEANEKTVTHNVNVTAKAADSSGIIRYEVAVSVSGRADLNFSKTFETVVRPPYPRTAQSVSMLIEAGKEEKLVIPGKWLPGSGKLAFSMDRSPVMAVLPALEFLREYPYGCLEQTVSRAWPYLTLDEIQNALLGQQGESAANNTKSILQSAVNRICGMATTDGGFALWPGYSRSAPWKSVNAIFFLQEAKAKVSVPPAVYSKSIDYLRFCLAAPITFYYNESYGYSTKAYAAFVLTKAGQPPLSWLQSLTEHENKMYPSGRIFLAAAKALKAGNSKALVDLDEKKLSLSKRIPYNESLESNLRNSSLLLYAWSLVDPNHSTASRLTVTVAEHLNKSRWYNPQDSGMAALALGTYVDKTGMGKDKGYNAVVSADGEEVAEAKNGERLLLGNDRLPMKDTQAPQIAVSLGQEGPAYCIYSLRGVPMAPPPAASSEVAVQRVWKDASGKVIDLSSGKVTLKRGDRITVELTVKPAHEVSDVVLSDLTPGGMEVENPRLSTSTASAAQESGETYGMYVDQREDRLLVFFDRMYNKVTYTYSMRAVSKGNFVLPPLAVDCMYDPAVNAITPAGVLVVE